jgi:hypothetical protein
MPPISRAGSTPTPRTLTGLPRTDGARPASIPQARTWTLPTTKGEWVQNASGRKSDPVNLYVHGSLDQLRRTFEAAGWKVPAAKTTPNMLRYGAGAVLDETVRGVESLWHKVTGRKDKLWHPTANIVATMPIAHLYYRGKPDVLSLERDNDPLGGRHHFRVFDTGQRDAQGKQVWAIAASLDVDTVLALDRPEQGFINHLIDKNADKERDEVLRTLHQQGAVATQRTVSLAFGKPAPTGLHSEDSRVFDVAL